MNSVQQAIFNQRAAEHRAKVKSLTNDLHEAETTAHEALDRFDLHEARFAASQADIIRAKIRRLSREAPTPV